MKQLGVETKLKLTVTHLLRTYFTTYLHTYLPTYLTN